MVKTQLAYETHRRINRKVRSDYIGSSLDTYVDSNKTDSNLQFNLILKSAPLYERSLPFPYEILLKIFHDVVRFSDHPLRDLCSMALVSETWRVIVLTTPSLWSRINFKKLPLTDGNLSTLKKLILHERRILANIKEIYLKGPVLFKQNRSSEILEEILAAPNLSHLYISKLDPQSGSKTTRKIPKAITECKQLKTLSIRNTKYFFGNQKWLSDYLMDNGKYLEELHLTSSMTNVSPILVRSLGSDYCPNLRVLDLSVTFDFIDTHTFDAILITSTMPNLKILRAANVSFKRVLDPPERYGLPHLEELSIPVVKRDAYRDDALLGTLAYGSSSVRTLDLRGASISAHALIDLPSSTLRVLHIDDICPLTRKSYGQVVMKWRKTLEILSLVKINCAETINDCLDALTRGGYPCRIKEVDLQGSEVMEDTLKQFLRMAKNLEKINLSSCRSLPRGCKGVFLSEGTPSFFDLKQKLVNTHSDSETEIDEEYLSFYNQSPNSSRKRRRVSKRYDDYVMD